MAKSPIEQVINQWNKRGQTFTQQGVNPNTLATIAKQDIERVKLGGGGMSDTQAALAIRAAGGKVTIPAKERDTALTALPGNLVRDVGDMAKGIIKLPEQIIKLPSDVKETVKALTDQEYGEDKYGLEKSTMPNPLQSVPAALRNLERLPFTGKWLPGVGTGADLTTPEGRKSLQQHPLGPVLDAAAFLLPAAKGAAGFKLAKEGALLKAGTPEAEAALAAKGRAVRGTGVFTKEAKNTVLADVAAKGLPYRSVAKKSPIIGDHLTRLEEKVAVARGFSTAEERTKRIYKSEWEDKMNSLMADMTPEEQVKFFEDEWHGIIPDDPKRQVAHDTYVKYNDWLKDQFTDEGQLGKITLNINGVDKEFYFPTIGRGGKLLKTHTNLGKSQEKLLAAQDSLASWTQHVESLVEAKQAKLDKVNREIQIKLAQPETPTRRGTLQRLNRRAAKLASEVENLPIRHGDLVKARNRYDKAMAKTNKLQTVFDKRVLTTAPAEYHPLLAEQLQLKTLKKIAEDAGDDSALISAAMADFNKGKYSTTWDPKEYNALVKDIEAGWTDLVREGFDPQFIHVVTPEEFGKAGFKPLDHHFTPGQVKERIWSNMTPTHQNLAVALSHAGRDYIRYKQNEIAFEQVLWPRTLTEDMADIEIQPFLDKEVKRGIAPDVARRKLFSEKFVKISDAEEFSFRNPRLRAMMKGEERYLPRDIYETWQKLSYPAPAKGVLKATTRLNAMFKTSLFYLSLRHAADETISGMVMVMGRGGKEEVNNFFNAWRMMREGTLPDEIPHSLDIDTPDKLLQIAIGSKTGKLARQIDAKTGFLMKWNTMMANMQRAMSYLGEKDRAVKEGFSEATAHELGIKHVEKALVDYNGMLPIEWQIIRQIFPFYSFAKYALQYVMSYPIDHPYRASIIHNLAAAEQKDWDSGLPQLWQQLFFWGQPDKDGNIKAVDVKVLNPFRDVDSLMSLQGFYSQLGPIPKASLIPLGINTISGTPDLYPEITYDEESGRLVSKRENTDSTIGKVLGTIIPPARSLDYFLQYSQDARRLKVSNPEAYNRQIFSALGVPFVPSKYNVPKARATSELARYSAAQQAASDALRTGDSTAVEGFSLVPYQGQLVNIEDFLAFLDKANSSTPEGFSPKALVRKK